ncbi:MAG: hypothetical protein A3E98_00220 [Candidatus Doudnabacteria bacterium RIFCSPHIGHO2_12_FULL_48_11]|uniref:Uridylate kinase n=1 Tax=Candidatus Doudnabacteria bacterium RIFCSPHIGHO2_01_FULL_46_24 TaxID=1817825 RepID=A0A1F5NUQ7_9BACT|nr:MAG: hypothetical protein A2720_02575 [Candidatus Doudnabacteria bacterium RIFCSPHIGHO2_01_FULL_46_24]OGE94235.1 MAG: hypothetical protein A3E98_00220 [Candidatus Doudnabacteria bacterium RIFCSPHIGHO2_12_FULL_48_11]
MKTERFVISLGGSLIVPEQIDVRFLSEFKRVIEAEVRRGRKFVLITGGGKIARRYAAAARELRMLNRDDLDWLGIHSTRLNGHLLRTIFRNLAHPEINTNPYKPQRVSRPIVIAAGFRPGFSTDHDAVVLAHKYGVKTILNLSNIDYVYDKDPSKRRNAKPLKTVTWPEFRKLVGNKWHPGANLPFDPIASKLAQKLGLTVIMLNGNPISNLKNFLSGRKFKGTIIHG